MQWRSVVLVGACLVLASPTVPVGATVSGGSDVSVQDVVFTPSPVTIHAGEQVTWTWTVPGAHSVVFDTAGSPADCPVADLVGTTCVRTFPTPGTYHYHDGVFGDLMFAEVQVLSAVATSSSSSSSVSLPTSLSSSSTASQPGPSTTASSTSSSPSSSSSRSDSSSASTPPLPDVVPVGSDQATVPQVHPKVKVDIQRTDQYGVFRFTVADGPDDPNAYQWWFPDDQAHDSGNPVVRCFTYFGTANYVLNVTFPDGTRQHIVGDHWMGEGCKRETDGHESIPAPGTVLVLAALVALALALRRRLR